MLEAVLHSCIDSCFGGELMAGFAPVSQGGAISQGRRESRPASCLSAKDSR
ncbi:hypothetical protein HMPREF1318_0030 [Actinomyces massiliensis F0489]|uniref:Uncharacterized protein n=1 Tax=Actinomyces massiliensis F0489 TaxID=1125718 RepID=J0N4R5_9ACTO|nr:hypothetical protein HMPREF1318_0030 [Actinomyces massiliensis F0489]